MKTVFLRATLCVAMVAMMSVFVACGGNSDSSVTPCEIDDSSIKDGYDAAANTLTDARDNQTYKTVTIGDQTWMAENLNYAYNEPTSRLDSSSVCYNNDAHFCVHYGRLYLWSAAMDSAAVFSTAGKGCGYGKTCASAGDSTGSSSTSAILVRGVCPEGWHLPNDDEWNTLFTAVGGTSVAGTKLKSLSGWRRSGEGTNAFGFSALPAGYSTSTSDLDHFHDVGDGAIFWSSSENDSISAYYVGFAYSHERAIARNVRKCYALSVRCLRDSE